MPTKAEHRRALRDRLPLPPDVRAEMSARICAQILALPQWRTARTVALFAAQPREPDVDALWQHAAGKTLACPRVQGDSLALYTADSLFDLQPARWGIREPAADPARLIAPAAVDIVIVPGVAFTRAGARCGRGGGYYDRLLATLPTATLKIGVCFAFQIAPDLPLEPHDESVDIVLTGQDE